MKYYVLKIITGVSEEYIGPFDTEAYRDKFAAGVRTQGVSAYRINSERELGISKQREA